jgi:uncharacterized protein YqeY
MLKQKIQSDVKEAMKQKNQEMVSVLRMALGAISSKEKEKRYNIAKENPEKSEEDLNKESEFGDEEIIGAITSEIKKRKDAIALYEQGGRPELAENEQKEIAILMNYLPAQIPADELKKMVQSSIEKIGATSVKDTGKIMADLMPQVKGKADNSEISKIIKELLHG